MPATEAAACLRFLVAVATRTGLRERARALVGAVDGTEELVQLLLHFEDALWESVSEDSKLWSWATYGASLVKKLVDCQSAGRKGGAEGGQEPER